MVQKAQSPQTLLDIIKHHDDKINQLFALQRSKFTPNQATLSMGGLGGSGTKNDPGGPTNNQNFLPTSGGVMIGALSFQPKVVTLTSSKRIDIRSSGSYHTSWLIVSDGGGFNLEYIDGAEHGGQILIIQGVESLTVPIVTTGNIETLTGSTFNLVNDDNIILIFDVTDNKWQQITSGRGGFGAWSGVSIDTNKDMLGFGLDNLGYLTFKVTSGVPQKIDNSVDGKVLNFLTNGNTRLNLSENASLNGTLELYGAGGSGAQADASFKTVSTRSASAGFRIGDFVFDGKNNAGTQITYADIVCVTKNISSGNEAGQIDFVVKKAGSNTIQFSILDSGIVTGLGQFDSFMTHQFFGLVYILGGMRANVRTVSSGTSSVASDDYCLVATNTSGTVNFNLPSASASPGQIFVFYKRAAGGTAVINRSGSDLIDGGTTWTLGPGAFETVTLMSDAASKWMVISTG